MLAVFVLADEDGVVVGYMALGRSIVAIADTSVDDLLHGLVHEHARFVFKVAFAVLRNHHDAEDVVQETFLRVMSHRRELKQVRDRRAWLARIAWRLAVDRRRSGSSAAQAAVTIPPDILANLRAPGMGAERMERMVISSQMLEIAEQLIQSLPRDLRDVLILSATEEMTSVEVAAVLKIPEASVRTRLSRARQLLNQKMASLLEGKEL